MRKGLENEDEYWERKREAWENPKAFHGRSEWDEDEPTYEDGKLFLDEEKEQIEAQGGYPLEELYEGDLLEIVEERTGIVPEAAAWVAEYDYIKYWYQAPRRLAE